MKRLAFFFASVLVAATTNAQLVINGDLNYDGDLNITDVVRMVDIIMGNQAKSYLFCPDDNHPHLIDLGLPSGTKWACCNVDATHPEEHGGCYAWGETKEKDICSWETYLHCDGSSSTCHDIGESICGTAYDVAHVKWGGNWQMPSLDQVKELLENCTFEWIWMDEDNQGMKMTSCINSGHIFIPAVGYHSDSGFENRGDNGLYWTGTHVPDHAFYAYCLMIHSGVGIDDQCSASWYDWWDDNIRCNGYHIRPSWVPTTQP